MKDKTLLKYLLWAFGLGWALQVPAAILALRGNTLIFQGLTMLSMFAPLVATVLADVPLRSLGWRPRLRGNVRWYLAGWLCPALLCTLGAALYFLLFPARLDTSGAAFLATLSEEARQQFDAQAIPASVFVLIQVIAALSYAPFLNAIPAVGEEAGWRGVMLPRLKERFGRVRGLLLGGVIWGAWHWPLMLIAGYEYGLHYWGAPLLGMLLFCLFTTALGILLDALFVKTGSIWAPALAHGAVNACSGLPLLLLNPAYADRLTVGPLPIGVIGGAPLFLSALFILLKKAPAPRELSE